MKLAEALLLRADLQKKTASLKARLVKSAVVQEGVAPPENPGTLLAELAAVLDQLEKLIARINRANLATCLRGGLTLTDALARRDVLAQKHAALAAAVDAAAPQHRYGLAEIRWIATVDAAALQKEADGLAGQLRELNGAIQEAGWAAEIEV